jgi:hypothetical protein
MVKAPKTEGSAIKRTGSADGVEVAACVDRMTKQRREGEANRPTRAKTGQRKLIKPSWTEFVRLADQAVVAFAGADMINRAEPRACGYSRRSRRLDTKWPETDERQLPRQTKPGRVSEGRRRTRLASSRTGENSLYGMNRGGGGNEVDGLMTFCHDARKGRYIGSHWPNYVRASALLDQLTQHLANHSGVLQIMFGLD